MSDKFRKTPITGAGRSLEYVVATVLALCLAALLFNYYRVAMPYTHGDTAFLVEAIGRMASGGSAVSYMLSQNAAEVELARAALEVYCRPGMVASQFAPEPYDVFSLHAYLILHLITPVARLVGALEAISALTALAFSAIPVIIYLYLRRAGASIWITFFVVAIGVLHPAWQISSGGQFYVDRLFIPFAMVFVLAVHSWLERERSGHVDRWPLALALVAGLLGGLTSERNMVVLAVFAGVYAVTANTSFRNRVIMGCLATTGVVYVVAYLYFASGNPQTAQVQNSLFNVSRLISAVTRPGVGDYLWFNGPLMLVSAMIVPRLFFAILPIMALNCFVSVGGAEKNGWLTHYHSHYYGFLLAAFLVAIKEALRKSSLPRLVRRALTPGLVVIMIALPLPVAYYNGQGIFLALWDYYGRPKEASSMLAQKAMFDELAGRVPTGSSVTGTEWGSAAWLLRGNTPNIFPLGMGVNEYVMTQALGDMPDVRILSAVRYRPDAESANNCFVPVIAENYDFVARSGTWALFKLKSQEGVR